MPGGIRHRTELCATVQRAPDSPQTTTGAGDSYQWNYPNADILESPTKGSDTLTIGDTSFLDALPDGGVGTLAQVSLMNDAELPVIAVSEFEYLRKQKVRIVAINTPNYLVSVADSLACEIRHAYLSRRAGGGSNGAGILMGGTNSCLIGDNVIGWSEESRCSAVGWNAAVAPRRRARTESARPREAHLVSSTSGMGARAPCCPAALFAGEVRAPGAG